jgi:ADP-heptose:LPS heptosyltransferase
LSALAAFGSLPVEFYSLQKGADAEAELANVLARQWNGPKIVDCSAMIEDFSDTAALLAQLDLLISVDTSTLHLAGAMGKPAWLLNRFDTCWRWMLERADTPWYPTVRLYRQSTSGDWDAVVQRVLRDLQRLAGDSTSFHGLVT